MQIPPFPAKIYAVPCVHKPETFDFYTSTDNIPDGKPVAEYTLNNVGTAKVTRIFIIKE